MSLRKLCIFLFVNCIFIFRIANTFVASYAMKYSEIFFVIRKFLAYTPPTIHASYGPVVTSPRFIALRMSSRIACSTVIVDWPLR